MTLSEFDKFEIKARAFRRHTGHWPPGKDSPAASGARDEVNDREAWDDWCKVYGKVVSHVLDAASKYLDEVGD